MRTNAPLHQVDAGIDVTNVVYERAIKVHTNLWSYFYVRRLVIRASTFGLFSLAINAVRFIGAVCVHAVYIYLYGEVSFEYTAFAN